MNCRYLQYSLLDEELLSMRHFELYQPLDTQATEKNKTKASLDFTNKHMVGYSNQFFITLWLHIQIFVTIMRCNKIIIVVVYLANIWMW